MKPEINKLKVKIFADGADLNEIIEMNNNSLIQGLTTNPTLMRKAGIKNYKKFAQEVLTFVKSKPISFEVFSDDVKEMEKQALEIASWGENVYIKIPVTNTKGVPVQDLVKKLVKEKVKVNVTAVMTTEQVRWISNCLDANVPNYVSIFAGRIADTGRDPIRIMQESIEILKSIDSSELIWASPRELLNIFQASEIGCHIITATTDILRKLSLVGFDLDQYSLETVKMFYKDASESNFSID
jgi:transaldolase